MHAGGARLVCEPLRGAHPQRLARVGWSAGRRRLRIAVGGGAEELLDRRRAPAPPRSRDLENGPTSSIASTATTIPRDQQPGGDPAAEGVAHAVNLTGAESAIQFAARCCGSATRAPTRSCPGTRSRASPPRSRPASTRSSSTSCARTPTSPTAPTGAAPGRPARRERPAARRPRLGRRPPPRAAHPRRGARRVRAPAARPAALRPRPEGRRARGRGRRGARRARPDRAGDGLDDGARERRLPARRGARARSRLDAAEGQPRLVAQPVAAPGVPRRLGLAARAGCPALVRRRAPELGVWAVWIYHPLITARLVDARARGRRRA